MIKSIVNFFKWLLGTTTFEEIKEQTPAMDINFEPKSEEEKTLRPLDENFDLKSCSELERDKVMRVCIIEYNQQGVIPTRKLVGLSTGLELSDVSALVKKYDDVVYAHIINEEGQFMGRGLKIIKND